jgi:hypothetical protein
VESTCKLLEETAAQAGRPVTYVPLSIPEAWDCLAVGDVAGHNRWLEQGIRRALAREPGIGCVVLAQLSTAVLAIAYPDISATLGVPVLTSAGCGFARVRAVLEAQGNEH